MSKKCTRIQRDLVEVLTNPIDGIVVFLPHDGVDMNHWVIRVACRDGPLVGQHFYFEIRFSASYPSVPPSVRSFTLIPHTCVDSVHYEVCLLMLAPPIQACRRYNGWSAAYSAYSLLLQMQDFFEEELLMISDETTISQCSTRVSNFETNELPGLKLEHMKYYKVKYEIPVTPLDTTPAAGAAIVVAAASNPTKKAWGSKCMLSTNSSGHSMKSTDSSSRSKIVSADDSTNTAEDGWTVVSKSKSVCASIATPKNPFAPVSAASASTIVAKSIIANNMFSVLDDVSASLIAVANAVSVPKLPPTSHNKSNAAIQVPSKFAQLFSCLPGNAKIFAHNHACNDIALGDDVDVVSTSAMVANSGSFSRLSNQTIHSILLYCEPSDIARSMVTCQLLRNVCVDGHIWRSLLTHYFPRSALIPPLDHPLSGQYWRQIWLLEANGARFDELRCFYSKKTYQQDVLGVPLKFTVNPKTGQVDYIYSTMELMALSTFNQGIRRTTWSEEINSFMPLYLTKEHFRRSLPRIRDTVLRLSQQSHGSSGATNYSHGNARAGARVVNSRRNAVSQSASRSFHPFMILDVIPRMMNTIMVLLVDGGIDEVDHCLQGYCQVHRLFVALVEEFPSLQGEITRRLRQFVNNPADRTKEHCPNLGELVALVSVCEEMGWLDVISAMTQESFSRSVLWLCRDCPDFARMALNSQLMTSNNVNPAAVCNSNQFPDSLLDELLLHSATRHNLFAFHCSFLKLVGCGPNGANLNQIARMHDRTIGLPPRHMKLRLQAELTKILSMHLHGWDGFFDAIAMERVDKNHLKRLWFSSVKSSFANKYHTLTTDFGRIQSRGVSNILLRGKSFPRVVFCIDTSGSMAGEFVDSQSNRRVSRLQYVKEELSNIFQSKLSHRNQFGIVRFDDRAHVWSRGLQQATDTNLRDAAEFVRGWHPDGGTSFTVALEAAFQIPNVEEVYFLSDGEDSTGLARLVQLVKRLSKDGAIKCHTTSFFAPLHGQQLLQAIAHATNGTFVSYGSA